MGKNTQNSSSQTETVETDIDIFNPAHEQDVAVLKEMQETIAKLEETVAKTQAENRKLKQQKSKNSDDIAPGIRKTKTFGGNYRNGYEDGTVAKAIQKQKEEQAKLRVQA